MIFNDLWEAIRCINDSQKRLSDFQAENSHRQCIPLPAPPKGVKQSSAIGSDGPILVDLSRPQLQVTESDEEAELKRFKEAV